MANSARSHEERLENVAYRPIFMIDLSDADVDLRSLTVCRSKVLFCCECTTCRRRATEI